MNSEEKISAMFENNWQASWLLRNWQLYDEKGMKREN